MLQKRALHNQISTTEHTPIKLYDRLILGKTRHNFAVLLFFLREMHDDESIQDALNIVNTLMNHSIKYQHMCRKSRVSILSVYLPIPQPHAALSSTDVK